MVGSKEDALRIAVKACNGVDHGKHRIVWIKNTLELEEIIISEALLEKAQVHSQIEILTQVGELVFKQGEPVFPW